MLPGFRTDRRRIGAALIDVQRVNRRLGGVVVGARPTASSWFAPPQLEPLNCGTTLRVVEETLNAARSGATTCPSVISEVGCNDPCPFGLVRLGNRGDTGPRFAAADSDGVDDLPAACALQIVASNSVPSRIHAAAGRQILGGLVPAT